MAGRTYERAQGYLVTTNGQTVFIRRVEPSRRERRDYGLPRVVFEVPHAGVHRTRREAVAEARRLARRQHP